MSKLSSYKCLISFLWTNALVVAIFELLLFSFIDPVEIAMAMNLEFDPGVFRIKTYVFTFLFLWLMFIASTFLNSYFCRLRESKYLQE